MSTVLAIVVVYFAVVAGLVLALATYAQVSNARRERREAARRLARDPEAVIAQYEMACPRLRLVQRDEVAERRAMRRERIGGAA